MYITGLTLVKLYILNKMCYGIPASLTEYAIWRGIEYTCTAIYGGVVYIAMGCPPSYDEIMGEGQCEPYDNKLHNMRDNMKHCNRSGVITTEPSAPPAYTLINKPSNASGTMPTITEIDGDNMNYDNLDSNITNNSNLSINECDDGDKLLIADDEYDVVDMELTTEELESIFES